MSPVLLPSGEDDFTGQVVQGLSAARVSYVFERVLGAGSQAVAWEATRRTPQGTQRVVLKVWSAPFVASHPEVARLVLRKESVALARLAEEIPADPFVVRFLDAGDVPRRAGGVLPWLALEHVPGGHLGTTLKARVEHALRTTKKGFGPRRTLRLLRGMLDGVSTLHRAGVIHRDLKPSNVLLCGPLHDELPKIGDLGVARTIGMKTTFGAHVSVGSLGFAAPEQSQEDRVGTWSDVFSLAALLSYVLTGAPPVEGSVMVVLSRLQNRELAPLDVPVLHEAWRASGMLAALTDVRNRAMTVRPRERTATVDRFRDAVLPLCEQASSNEPPEASGREDAEPLRGWKEIGRHEPAVSHTFRAVALSPDGRAVAASPTGLWFWDGTDWKRFTGSVSAVGTRIGGLARVGPKRWVAALDGGEVVLFGPDGVCTSQQVGPPQCEARAAAAFDGTGRGDPKDLRIVVGFSEGGRSWLLGFSEGRWLTPRVLDGGEEVQSVATPDPSNFAAVVGKADGAPRPLTWGAAPVFTPEREQPEGAPTTACSLDPQGRLWCASPTMRLGSASVVGGLALRGRLLAVRADSSGGMAVDSAGRVSAW
jgi:serine/threonine protein kinase